MVDAVDGAADQADVVLEQVGATGVVTLNRPRQLNALNTAMRAAMAPALQAWARNVDLYAVVFRSNCDRAFCAGGDVRELADWGRNNREQALASLAAEYTLNWQLECYSKPTVSLIDGMVMGSGVGLTAYNTHRVAGAGYQFAMPETGIGFFPDIGTAGFLSRLDNEIGLYLGLTGARIGRGDAYRLGLVTHCIDAAHFDHIADRLADADTVDELLDGLHEEPDEGELAGLEDVIARCFSADTVEDIVARLQAESGEAAVWAAQTADTLEARSPLALKVALRELRQARTLELASVLELDYVIAAHLLDGNDFYEGVRAVLIDKDAQPRWQPANLADVGAAMVEACFAPHGDHALTLPTRTEMQALRK